MSPIRKEVPFLSLVANIMMAGALFAGPIQHPMPVDPSLESDAAKISNEYLALKTKQMRNPNNLTTSERKRLHELEQARAANSAARRKYVLDPR